MTTLKRASSVLPKPDSSLATVESASTIAAANEAVKKVIAVNTGKEKGTACSSHGQRKAYEHFTPKERARIGKRASEHGSHSSPMAVNLAFGQCQGQLHCTTRLSQPLDHKHEALWFL